MLQNIFVAGWSRKPEALGLPLKFEAVIGSPKVSAVIMDVERSYPKAGRALVGTFFPGGLFPSEERELGAIEAKERDRINKAKDMPRDHKAEGIKM